LTSSPILLQAGTEKKGKKGRRKKELAFVRFFKKEEVSPKQQQTDDY